MLTPRPANATAAATATASTTHSFTYTVVASEYDNDGIQVVSTATLSNPGRIQDTDANAMTATALPDNLMSHQSGHKVDAVAPTVSSLAFSSTGPYRLDDVITLAVTFSEPVTFGPNEGHVSPMQIGFTMGSNGRAFDSVPNTTLSSTQNFTYTVAANDTDSDGIACGAATTTASG